MDLTAFRRNYLVAGLSDADMQRVADLAEFRVASGGEEIVRLGQKNADLLIILDGVAQVCAEGGVVLAERSAPSVIGEMALVDDAPRSAYVVAKGTLSFARIDGRVLRKFMVDNEGIGFTMLVNLSRVLAMRLREASKNIEELSGKLRDPWYYST